MSLHLIVSRLYSLVKHLRKERLQEEDLDELYSILTALNRYLKAHDVKEDERKRVAQLLITQVYEELDQALEAERSVQEQTHEKLLRSAQLLQAFL